MRPGITIIPDASIAGTPDASPVYRPGPTAAMRSPSMTTCPPKCTDRAASIVTTVPLPITRLTISPSDYRSVTGQRVAGARLIRSVAGHRVRAGPSPRASSNGPPVPILASGSRTLVMSERHSSFSRMRSQIFTVKIGHQRSRPIPTDKEKLRRNALFYGLENAPKHPTGEVVRAVLADSEILDANAPAVRAGIPASSRAASIPGSSG